MPSPLDGTSAARPQGRPEARRRAHQFSLRPGHRLGAHVILAPIAVGGMGEIYRARDTSLGRDVAIKVLRRGSASPANYARMKREARLLARLSHPSIAAIYEQQEGVLVMELVEGSNLAQRIQSGPIALPEAVEFARQIADALKYAHSRGVIHRDLKPSNIMLTPAGRVKLLDFGLSKAANERPAISDDPEESPTVSLSLTQAGAILGTSAYMSPEQTRGQKAGKGGDVWAFGVVFYEMLTGAKLFGGPTISDTVASILTKEPDLDRVPRAARKLLRLCLSKNPEGRLRDIGDVRLLLEDIDARRARSGMHRSLARILAAVRRSFSLP